jgi:tRNA (guanine26-N2/guanine27-N2)-dimethyltransferase
MIIGAAVREAAARGLTLTPVFSLYSYHGPVFRVMLRATRSAEWHAHHYGFMGHCFVHGDNYTVGWRGLGAAICRYGTVRVLWIASVPWWPRLSCASVVSIGRQV